MLGAHPVYHPLQFFSETPEGITATIYACFQNLPLHNKQQPSLQENQPMENLHLIQTLLPFQIGLFQRRSNNQRGDNCEPSTDSVEVRGYTALRLRPGVRGRQNMQQADSDYLYRSDLDAMHFANNALQYR